MAYICQLIIYPVRYFSGFGASKASAHRPTPTPPTLPSGDFFKEPSKAAEGGEASAACLFGRWKLAKMLNIQLEHVLK